MVDRVERALACFEGDCNCAQALLVACGAERGLEPETAMRLARPFGGGMGLAGGACGAVSGALMALGLASDGDPQTSDDLAGAFLDRFRARHGSAACRDLLELDLSVPGALDEAYRLNLFATRCPQFIRDAAEIVQELLGE